MGALRLLFHRLSMMERLSCCTYPLQGRPIDEALAAIADAGFAKVDVLGRAPHLEVV